MVTSTAVAAVIVLYNPDKGIMENIESCVNQVGKLYIVDNSEKQNFPIRDLVKDNMKIEYINNDSNLGVAAALNIGAREAIKDGFDYLLTMDQDSSASSGMVQKQLEIMKSSPQIGIVAAEHVNLSLFPEPNMKYEKEVLFTMTSGNLLNLSAYKKVGGFWENLFIDHVDHEYCLRLRQNGYKIIKTSEAIVYHKLGNAVKKKFFNYVFCPSNHPPIRLYYRTRNRFYIDKYYKKIFPEYVKEDRKNMIREFIEIIFYEKNLLKKFGMIIKGYIHYKKNILGKYHSNT